MTRPWCWAVLFLSVAQAVWARDGSTEGGTGGGTGSSTGGGTQGPLHTWELPLKDPSEVGRWKLLPPLESPADQIRWDLLPRSNEAGSSKILRFSSTARLDVETHFLVARELPPSFRPTPGNDLVLEWEWRLSDTERSDGIALLLMAAREEGDPLEECVGLISHTRFTVGWHVLFDPPRQWRRHRYNIPHKGCWAGQIPPHRIGVGLHFLMPVDETVELGDLRLEEWPAGSQAIETIWSPHRPPGVEHAFSKSPLERLYRAMAGALEDLDGDGFPELLLFERRDHAHLYRFTPARETYEDITHTSGLHFAGLATGAMFLDLDGDRDPDLIVAAEMDTPRFFENTGHLSFRERFPVRGDPLSFWYIGAADDVDRDRDPDLLFISPLEPQHILFLRNAGDWSFEREDLFETAPGKDGWHDHFSASFADFDEDGWPDLFLGREYLFRNRQGRLDRIGQPWRDRQRAKVEGGLWADFQGDGLPDLLILRDQAEVRSGPGDPSFGRTRLLISHEEGFLDRSTALPELESAEVALAEDFDNDGDLDLYLCQRDRANYLLLNDGRGHFVDATENSGFADAGSCDAAVAGDLDGDGSMDLVILGYGSPPRLFYNQLLQGRWLGIRAEGLSPATDAIGARVRLHELGSSRVMQTRWQRRGRGFGSTGPNELRFGLGERSTVDVEVRFPGGGTRRIEGVRAGQTLLVREVDGSRISQASAEIAELHFGLRRSFRRNWPRQAPLTRWGLAAVAFVVGLGMGGARRWRLGSLGFLGIGGALFLILGSIPGGGLAGSPFLLWTLGGSCGLLAGYRRRARIRGRTQLRRRREAALLELISFTLDFRHAGLEEKSLVWMESLSRNLVLAGEVQLTFYKKLVELRPTYLRSTAERLNDLADLAMAVFAEPHGAPELRAASDRLSSLFAELPGTTAEVPAFEDWTRRFLRALGEVRKTLRQLLGEIDQICSCDVTKVIEEIGGLHGETLKSTGVTLTVDVRTDGPIRGLIPHSHLSWILENLFSGALAAMAGQRDGKIEIRVRADLRGVELLFGDNGPGVPEPLRQHLFEPTFSPRPPGGGRGLPRSRETLGSVGGHIELLASQTGACFRIFLRRPCLPTGFNSR